MPSISRWSLVASRWLATASRWSLVGAVTCLYAVTWLYVVSGFSRTDQMSGAQYTFEEVASGLKHRDAATRLRAIAILKEANYPEAAGPIGEVLGDPDIRVQLAALDAERSLFTIRQTARRRKVGFVIEARDRDLGAEGAAARLALAPNPVPRQLLAGLTAAMRDEDPRVRYEAIDLFGALGPLAGPDAFDALRGGIRWTIEAIRRGDPRSQALAASAAGHALRDCGTQPPRVESALCAELGNTLIEAMNSREPPVRRAAMRALGDLRYAEATQALENHLSHYQRGADAAAALEGLSRIGHEASASIFIRHLTTPDAGMRRLAVEGLARTAQPDHLGDVQRLGATERSKDVRLALQFATIKLGAKDSIDPTPLIAALNDGALRSAALGYLLELSVSMAPTLAESLRDNDADIRRSIADVLGFSRDPQVIPALEAAAKDEDADAALAARRAIQRLKR